MKIRLEPYYDCKAVGSTSDGVWESLAADPQFLIRSGSRGFAPGPCRFVFETKPGSAKWIDPLMYFDLGEGWVDSGKILLKPEPRPPGTHLVSYLVNIPPNVRQIRFDPTCAAGTFVLKPSVTIQRFRLLLGAARKLARVWRNHGLFGVANRVLNGDPSGRGLPGQMAQDTGAFQKQLVDNLTKRAREYIAAPALAPAPDAGVRLVAYYLPQFHPIPENDKWWGKGFTEWTNVGKAMPMFEGHYQPRLPGEFGYYDLRNPQIMRDQAALARRHGIEAFCFHYYWFDGHRLLESPVEAFLKDPSIDIGFCLCWANENWSRRWDGSEQDVLIAQNHSPEDDIAIIDDLIRAFRDPRYLRVDGKPVMIIYRAAILPEVKETLARWRRRCIEQGIGEIHLVAAQSFGLTDPLSLGFDAGVEFPPHGVRIPERQEEYLHFHDDSKMTIYDYRDVVETESARDYPDYRLYRCAMPGWDNTARKGKRAHAFSNSSPGGFRRWLDALIDQSMRHVPAGERLIFVNAWNEWAEGAYLEPDRRYGYANLMACHGALTRVEKAARPKVSVIMPTYKHEQYVEQAIRSVLDQTYDDFELLVIDDCSPDGTYAVAERVLAQYDAAGKASLHRMPINSDAYNVINYGIANSSGEYVTVINSDDAWTPDRLATIIGAMEKDGAGLAFSRISVIDQDGAPLDEAHPVAAEVYRRQEKCFSSADPLMVHLLQYNVCVTTGNLVFKRSLFDRLGGFSQLRLCHDWDFVLRASFYGKLLMVDSPGYLYRMHTSNTFSSSGHLSGPETETLLTEFFGKFDQHPQQELLRKNVAFQELMGSDQYRAYYELTDD
ncbi:glycoside hydrolase family 99-like domain-containing protein [Lysobacter sp. BMK333-48F3]|uniref:glycoside hydrolase family 99-like domain-containing protein n=1 Tax=Lysobacter sp. BMK333-48F3 TaxID=2867962 RepID=UPI001C8C2DEA|nr:glycoside hydrolase family 99-like domain-containing protein [Lysobacter sp. BMK333-48F3]